MSSKIVSLYAGSSLTAILSGPTMPLNARQIDAVKDLLRRAAELITDAQSIATTASEPGVVASLTQLRRNVADEIADLDAQPGGRRSIARKEHHEQR